MSINNDSRGIPKEFKGYIFLSHGSFAVKNDLNGILITFGRFNQREIACAATNLLIKSNWDMAQVKDDRIGEFNDEFYVFKVMNNHLIFDSKFDSFEKAVEFLEIKSKCNDFHNDILNKKKRKKKYSNLTFEPPKEYKEISNIYRKDDKFVVRYKSRGKDYGIFNSIDVAIVAKQMLIKNNWKFSNSVEIEFYESFYWVFKIERNFLTFIEKFESYEDALDCLDLNKIENNNSSNDQSLFGGKIRKIDDSYIEDIKNDPYVIENNFIKSIVDKSKPNIISVSERDITSHSYQGNKKPKKRKVNYLDDNIDFEALKSKITRDNIKIKEMGKNSNDNIIEVFENLELKLNIVSFQDNSLKDYYSVTCLPNGEFDVTPNLYEFVEFKYIWKLLNFYKGNLNKIHNLSSIHYFNDSYYIIKVFDNKLIISGKFSSYSDAESNIEFLYDYYSKKSDTDIYPHNIKHYGNVFKLKENHNGKTFELEGFRSLEELKAIIDIFDYHEWNPKIFKEYDIFFYNGMYWIINYFFYYVKLAGRFYSKEDAIEYKCK